MNKSEKFWDKRASTFDAKDYPKKPLRLEKYDKIRKLLSEDHEMLDYGCATGSLILELADHVNHVHALDISSEMIAKAEFKIKKAGLSNVTFQVGDLDALSQTKKFDIILASYVLHLVPNPESKLKTIHDLLKPGGLLIGQVPCLAEKNWFTRTGLVIFTKIMGLPFLSKFKVTEVNQIISNAGFTAVESSFENHKIPGYYFVVKKQE